MTRHTDDTPMEPIEIEDVRKSYGDVEALRGVSLSIEPGTIHALVGPNGSGKTTLFRILLGLTRPDAGQVSMPEATVGCGFQEPQVYGDLTVAENVDVFGSLAGAPQEWTGELLERVGLHRARNRLASDLSGGQAKKLDLALAYVDHPDVVLLDEPFADVDDDSKRDLLAFFESYRDDDRTLVITTHQLRAFEDALDAMTVLRDGRVLRRTHARDLGDRGFRRAYRTALNGE